MKRVGALAVVALLVCAVYAAEEPAAEEGWISLFDGKSLDGWKVGENANAFKVEDGMIVVNGNVGHLFYDGKVKDHHFKNFEFKADVMTFPKANSGIYFHTGYQEKGWPSKGFEAQVNNSHSDWKRTGGLYNVADIKDPPAKDNEWFNYYIKVEGKKVTIKINGKTTVEWTQPDDWKGPDGNPGRVLSSGTFALQAHDPGSKVCFKNILVKPLAD
jgi:hypothetical protein